MSYADAKLQRHCTSQNDDNDNGDDDDYYTPHNCISQKLHICQIIPSPIFLIKLSIVHLIKKQRPCATGTSLNPIQTSPVCTPAMSLLCDCMQS